MRCFLCLVAVGVVSAGLSPINRKSAKETSVKEQFQEYKEYYGYVLDGFLDFHNRKSYASTYEERLRYFVFEHNLRFIAEHNAKFERNEVKFRVGVNQFADMTNEEFQKALGVRRKHPTFGSATVFSSVKLDGDLPDTVSENCQFEVDWRNQGYVTPIKDQGQCGSCWSFATTGAVEGHWAKYHGDLVSLSEQNLVDCSSANNGCEWGWPYKAMDFIKDNDGIDTEASYPYQAQDDFSCRFNPDNKAPSRVTGHVFTDKYDEQALKEAVATKGPVALYQSGVYDEPDCSQTDSDHCVLVIGYGTDNGSPYWLVKNSWGTSWGDDGYIEMSRNANNQCGIASQAVYPTVP